MRGRKHMTELLPASKYYGKHATGWVLLVDGQPHHLADKREALELLRQVKALGVKTMGLESNPRGLRRNPSVELSELRKIKGFEPWMAQNPQFCQAVDKFVEFHGVMPQSINKKSMPGMGKADDVQFFVHMGKAMDTTYKPTHRGSKKYGSAYIHEFGEELGRKPKDSDLPDQVCTPDGKNIITFGGRFEVKDWVRK